MTSDPAGSPPLPQDTVSFNVDYVAKHSRLTTFFRFFTALPHMFVLMFYGLAAIVVVIVAWFALLFTGRYPEGMYSFVEGYVRYYARVYAYLYLVADPFPPFGGSVADPYPAHLSLGPPKDGYSRVKVFFRAILAIPFYIVAYLLNLIAELCAFFAWFVIVITGKLPKGLHDAIIFGLSFNVRIYAYYYLLTEDWPKFTDDAVAQSLAERGYAPSAQPPEPPPAPPPIASA